MSGDTNSAAVQRADERRRIGKHLQRMKPKKSGHGFYMMVHAYWQSSQYAKLSPRAVKLLVDLACQFRGRNNGDLTTAWSVMKACGWRSKHLLYKAQEELERRGWIVKTRQGFRAKGVNAPTLWALTFEGIDDCRDSQGHRKMDPGVKPDPQPLHLWRLPSYDLPVDASKRAVRKKLKGGAATFPGYGERVVPLKVAGARVAA